MKDRHDIHDTLQKLEEIEALSGKTPGALKTHRGECPTGGRNSMACMFCPYGHMLECHYPQTCEEAECSHWQEGNSEEPLEDPNESDVQQEENLLPPVPLQETERGGS